ncbi:DUF2442 domain-containing protein [Lysinibacillus sp. FSL K6-0232]|uniref:DUF2442 domain-containing protein n=1 Tax=unclassified Lysinibacillus TaxID=2636778 RepID=UPI0030F51D65
MRIVAFYPTKTFKLIIEFENSDYRLLDMREFLRNEQGLMKELINHVDVFLAAMLDEVAGTIKWVNDVDFDPEILYKRSIPLDNITNNGSDEKFEICFVKNMEDKSESESK